MNAVIFDLDGVICSTDKYHYIAWKRLADKYNVYFDEDINNTLRGVSRADSLEIILKHTDETYSDQKKQEMLVEKNDTYKELLTEVCPKDILPYVKETLNELKNRHFKLAIGSSSKNAKYILKQLGLENYFDAISDGNNIKRSKPDPEVFLKAADMLSESPDKCIVVEDAMAGIEAAVAGGFTSVGIGEAKKHPHVTYRIDSIKELLEISRK